MFYCTNNKKRNCLLNTLFIRSFELRLLKLKVYIFFFFLQQESIFQQQSPTKRRESTPLLEKIKTDVTLVKQKPGNLKQGEKPKEIKEELPITKYITSQVNDIEHLFIPTANYVFSCSS